MEHDATKSQPTAIGVGTYALRDAALLLHISYAKLRRWAAGYWYSVTEEDRFSQPVVPGDTDELDERILSFHELMELFVIGFFRTEGVSMAVIRAARARAQALFGSDYPFATEQIRTDGIGIFSDLPDVEGIPDRRLQLELSKGQTAFRKIVEPFFRTQIDFAADGLASTYWPLGRNKPVTLDARRSFGRPIVGAKGTPTFVLYNMRQAGEELGRIAAWYEISRDELDAAIEYEESLRAAA